MKAIITDRVHPYLLEQLSQLGYSVEYKPDITPDALDDVISQYHGVVINSKIVMDNSRIQRSKQLRWIARLGSGLEIIDLPFAQSKGIHVINSPEGNRNAVAEHAMGMLLMLFNNLQLCDQEVRSFSWDREACRGREIMGKTIGIVGFGHTGSAFATKLSGWGVQLLTYDKYNPIFGPGYPHVKSTSIEELQERADILSFHLPLTPETEGLVDFDFLSKCKPGVIIVNTSRGKVVDIEGLTKALHLGIVGGACLDVFPNEKPRTYSEYERSMYEALFLHKNVIISPHVAGWTEESLKRIAEVTFQKIKAIS